jgi:hypothetical protein
MFAGLTRNRDGFLSWRSRSYSSLRIRVHRAAGNTSPATVQPESLWLRGQQRWTRELLLHDAAGKTEPVDWQYVLTWQAGPKVEVKGATTGKVVSAAAVRPRQPFVAMPGVALTVRGQAAVGDRFVLAVERPKDFDFAVHDGVVLTPICRFIALVRADRALRALYGKKADDYLKVIESDLIPKWDPYWRNWRGGGLLVGHVDEALAYPGITLPHNQYLALGNALVWLYRITRKEAYREKAAKMARFFKSCLRLVDGHYEWNYWDATGEWDKPWDKPQEKRPEDTGHGSLDIGFVLACAEAGIVFTAADLKRFADTFLEVMWNGSLDQPTIGGYVNASKPTRQSGNLQEWLLLCKVELKVRRICERVIPAQGSLRAKAQLYLLWTTGGGRMP